MMLLPNCAAVLTAALGCLGLLFPCAVGRVLHIAPAGPSGISELRATYGGFFLCLGLGCLAAQSRTVFAVVGAAWCAAASARLVSCVLDGARPWHAAAGMMVEAGLGLALLSGELSLHAVHSVR